MQKLIDAIRTLANGRLPDRMASPLIRSRSLSMTMPFVFGGRGEVSQHCNYAIIVVLHKKKGRTECSNSRDISLVVHGCKILVKIIARRLSEYCEHVAILPEEMSSFGRTDLPPI